MEKKASNWIARTVVWTGLACALAAAEGNNFQIVVGSIFQDIPTIPGQTYLLRIAFGGNEDTQFNDGPLRVSWGTGLIATIPVKLVSFIAPQWKYFEYPVISSAAITRLQFSVLPLESFPYLDDVSLFAVPEPCAMHLWCVGLAVVYVRRYSFRTKSKIGSNNS